jgi:2-(1,2-epoxy-1,2-dihydrophenyl)acetyl-CoA isomerase
VQPTWRVGETFMSGDAFAGGTVLAEIRDGVAILTLNRPERLNAVNGELSRALNLALGAASQSRDVRVILITGAGKAFCAGADSKVLNEYAADPTAPNSGSGRLRYGALMALPKPVIAAVNGPCAGIGVALACCSDIRLASDGAFFLAPFVQLGLTAEVGLGWLLPRLIGTGNALDFLMAARRVGADEALSMGLVTRVYPSDSFLSEARAYAAAMAAAGAPGALLAIKRQVYSALTQDFAAAETDSARLTFESLKGPEFKEAMAAQREGRRPQFEPVSAPFLARPGKKHNAGI